MGNSNEIPKAAPENDRKLSCSASLDSLSTVHRPGAPGEGGLLSLTNSAEPHEVSSAGGVKFTLRIGTTDSSLELQRGGKQIDKLELFFACTTNDIS